MLEDIRYALRQARKAPGFAFAAIATLALGIGAAAAMFVLIQGVLLSPPPYANPDRLVFLTQTRLDGQPHLQGMTIGQWMDWRSSATTIEPPALYRWTFNFLVLPDGSRSIGGMVVTQRVLQAAGRQADAGPRVSPERSQPSWRAADRHPAGPSRRAGNRRDHRPRVVGTPVQPRSEHHRQDVPDQPHAGAAADRRRDAARRSLPA